MGCMSTATAEHVNIDLGIQELYPLQYDAFFHKYPDGSIDSLSCTEASTKSGKTHAAILWIIDQALNGPDSVNHWWIAPVYRQARIAHGRIVKEFKDAPFFAKYSQIKGEETVTLINGAMIHFLSGDRPDHLYGEDVYSVVLDEASDIKEEAWWAVQTVITYTKAPIRMIGNVRGRNWFWQLCRKIEVENVPGETYHRIDWRDAVRAGVLDIEQIKQARRRLPPMKFRELYEAIAMDSGAHPFGLEAIANCVSPMTHNQPVAFGVDLAKSLNWTVVIGLDMQGTVCRYARWQRRDWTETVYRIKKLIGHTRCYMDSTGVGDPVLDFVRAHNSGQYKGVDYFRNRTGLSMSSIASVATSDARNKIKSFKFNPTSKQQLMEGLAVHIQNQSIRFPDNEIRKELDTFFVEETPTGPKYKAPDGMHDDCVDALALAVKCISRPVRRMRVVA